MINKNLKTLEWWDIGIVTMIMFAPSLFLSKLVFLYQDQSILATGEVLSTTSFITIVIQLCQLQFAIIYLKMTKFDYTQIKCSMSWKGTLIAIALYLSLGVVDDLIYVGADRILTVLTYTTPLSFGNAFLEFNVNNLVYLLFNSFYSEFFFLGVCLSVSKELDTLALFYSLLVRCCLHLYTLDPVVILTQIVIGCVFYYLYTQKYSNIYPYALAHALITTLGISFVQFV